LTRHLRSRGTCQKTPRDVAVRRAYRRCVGNVSACSGHRQHKDAICRLFTKSPLTDSNRRPPPYHALAAATAGTRWQRLTKVLTAFVGSPLPPVATVCARSAPEVLHDLSSALTTVRLRADRDEGVDLGPGARGPAGAGAAKLNSFRWPSSGRGPKTPPALVDRRVVDARLAPAHQPVLSNSHGSFP
jgi:hypothetical protein